MLCRKFFAGPANAADELAGPEAQTVSFEVSATNTGLFTQTPSISPTGVLTFTPAPNATGSSVVSVSLVDSGSSIAPHVNRSSTATFTITLKPVNDEPVFTAGGNITIAEDAGPYNQVWATSIFNAAGLAQSPPTSTDESTQTLAFEVTEIVDPSLPGYNANLFTAAPAIGADGRLTFTTALNQNGSKQFKVLARDSGSSVAPNDNESSAVTFTITVTAVNDAPLGVPDTYRTTEDAPLISTTNDVSDNDSDPDGDAFSVIAGNTTSARGASVLLRADGSFEYDPRTVASIQAMKLGENSIDTFTYRLQDSLVPSRSRSR